MMYSTSSIGQQLRSGVSVIFSKTKSKYDQEILQSHTADQPMAPRGKATEQSQDTKKRMKV